jgi:hypothetical protein
MPPFKTIPEPWLSFLQSSIPPWMAKSGYIAWEDSSLLWSTGSRGQTRI